MNEIEKKECDFICLIRKISTRNLLQPIAEIIHHLFINTHARVENPMLINMGTHFYQTDIAAIMNRSYLTNIAYYSIRYSNDLRGKKEVAYNDFSNIYTKFSEYNGKILSEKLNTLNPSVFLLMFGMGQEQFFEQHLYRHYYSFTVVWDLFFQSDSILNFHESLEAKIGIESKEFVRILGILLINIIDNKKLIYSTIGDNLNEPFVKFLKYYSVSYEEVKKEKKSVFEFSNFPFVLTQSNEYILINSFALFRLQSDGIYWLVRNYYREKEKQDIQYFPNHFGDVFKDFIRKILIKYCIQTVYDIDDLNDISEKKADWVIESNSFNLIIEQKSVIPRIDVKSEFPDSEIVREFFEGRIFNDAIIQLNNTEGYFKVKKCVKTVLVFHDVFIFNSLKNEYPYSNKELVQDIFIMNLFEFELLMKIYSISQFHYEDILNKFVDVGRVHDHRSNESDVWGIILKFYPDYIHTFVNENQKWWKELINHETE